MRIQHLPFQLTFSAALVLALTACGGSSSNEETNQPDRDDHTHVHIDTDGRLVIGEAGSNNAHVFDLDSKSILQTFAADSAPSAIYASPGNRYALLFQRAENKVQFIDGGLWQEDHGDHLHDYQAQPQLLAARWSGATPSHYERHDALGAIFFDGSAETNANASVTTFNDLAIGSNTPLAQLSLPVPMHGTAEPRGEYLLTTYRKADAETALPDQVELYKRNGAGYDFVRRFESTCPLLHGSYSNEKYTAFGCGDGVLLISQQGDVFTERKIPNPADMPADIRISTLTGHHALQEFVGFAGPNHVFAINPDTGTFTRIAWTEEHRRRGFAIDGEGKNLFLLDAAGKLHIISTQNWQSRAALDAISDMPTAAPFPSLAASQAEDEVYLTDVNGKRIVVVDAADARISAAYPLNFAPGRMAWLGLPKHDH